MSVWTFPDHNTANSMAGIADRTPSLGRSDDCNSSAGPDTPSDKSPFIYAQTYSIPPPTMDAIALPHRVGTPQPAPLHTTLPNILDPQTAANVPIRHICCIGAGYVGMSRDLSQSDGKNTSDTCHL